MTSFYFHWLFQPIQGLRLLFNSVILLFTERTPLTGDQLVARPLPKHRTTQPQNKRIHTPNIHALSEIRTHDPSVQASEDSIFLRPRGYRHRSNGLIEESNPRHFYYKTKNLLKQAELGKINKCNYKLTFSKSLFEKVQQSCRRIPWHGCGISVNWQFE
jgi:hypothetical protein